MAKKRAIPGSTLKKLIASGLSPKQAMKKAHANRKKRKSSKKK